ncbi:MAG TPA: glycosyltransferase [Candidatus Binatia bacterium]|nr:glycosyltransferase [Candidatus Binatia bacterium]
MKQMLSASRRILMIAPTPFFADRGCHVRILGEAKSLMRLGHKVILCTYFLGRDVEGIPTERTLAVPWYKKLSAGPSWHKPYIDLLLLWKVLRACHRFRPDIIHAHLHEGIVIGKLASRIFRVPLVADLQGSLTDELLAHSFLPNYSWVVKLMRRIEKKINQMPEHLIVSSTETARTCVDVYGLSADRVSPVMDGVDLEIFSPRKRDTTLETLFGLSAPRR